MSAPVRTRFAPSPTGLLHLGNVRTALLNALAARQAGGAFVVRIEDTDAARSRPELVAALADDLHWLGLDWQEGPDVEGPYGPYLQSARGDIYARYFDGLSETGRAYPCFCTPEELAAARSRQLAAGRPPRYPGTCAHLSAAQVEARLQQGRAPALRFRVPADIEVRFDDLVRGTQTFATQTIGDFVIRRADGTPAFFFSNALDDALMHITHVLRGEDHLANTPRQLLLLEALELPAPRYGHLGLLVGSDGAPLSKRHGSASLRDLRAQGFLPGAVLNYLARLGHHYRHDPGYAEMAALADGFEFDRLGGSPAQFDRDQLSHWQKLAVAQESDAQLWDWIATHAVSGGETAALVPAGQSTQFVQTIRDNLVAPEDALIWARAVFAERDYLSEAAKAAIGGAGADFFRVALAAHTADIDFKPYAREVGAAAGVQGKSLYMPLRAALTGQVHGPELARLWELLGPARVRARLEAALQTSKSKQS